MGEGLVDSGRGRRRGLGHQDFSVCRAVRRVGVVVVPMVARRRAGDDMGHMSRLVRGQALGLVAAGFLFTAALGGCTSGETPTSPPSAPSSTAVAPTTAAIPTTSAVSDDEAVISATGRYLDSVNAAMRDRSSDRFVDTFWPGCVVCEQDASRIDGLAKKGHLASGGELAMASPRIESRDGVDKVIVIASVSTGALTITDSSGKTTDKYVASSGLKRFLMVKRGGVWKVGGILP